jgi:hypothetical protein
MQPGGSNSFFDLGEVAGWAVLDRITVDGTVLGWKAGGGCDRFNLRGPQKAYQRFIRLIISFQQELRAFL